MTRKTWTAAALLACCATESRAQRVESAESLLQVGRKHEMVDGNLTAAIESYKKALAASKGNRAIAAKVLLRLGECYEKRGDAEARQAYQRLLSEYGDQKEQAREAQARLTALAPGARNPKAVTAQRIAGIDDDGGRVTPDGKWYVYTDWSTGDLNIRDLGTGAVRKLTDQSKKEAPGYWAWGSLVSPDGKRFALRWVTGRGNQQRCFLRTINVDGSGIRTIPIAGEPYWIDAFDWTRDSKSLLVQITNQGKAALAFVDVETGEAKIISGAPGVRDIAGLTGDQRCIVYSRQIGRTADYDIFAFDLKAGTETPVVSGPGADRRPLWVPGTDRIVFHSDRSGKPAIWTVRFRDGGAAGPPTMLDFFSSGYEPRGITRDGSLYYGVTHETRDIFEARVDPETLSAQGEPRPAVESFPGRNRSASWQGQGDSFAYVSARTEQAFRGTVEVVVRRPDGREKTFAAGQGWWGTPRWCGPGPRLALLPAYSATAFTILDTETGARHDVPLKTAGRARMMAFSGDCAHAYLSLQRDGGPRIASYNLSSHELRELPTIEAEWESGGDVSPDGLWLAVQGSLPGNGGRGVLLISMATGAARLAAAHPEVRSGPLDVVFTPDSKRLLYARHVVPRPWAIEDHELWWVPVEGGEPRFTGIRAPYIGGLSIHPDGTRILFSTLKRDTEMWVLRNLPLN